MHNTSSEFTDEFADTSNLGALASGDVYDDDQAIGYYYARWFPDQADSLELLVVLASNPQHIAVGFRGWHLECVDADSLWVDWGAHALLTTAADALHTYPDVGRRARALAEFVLCNDAAFPP